jgi:site-specific DNA-cytosine methylase
MIFVDLFCGIGGFSQAAKNNDHDLFLAVDNDPQVLKVYTKNHAGINTLCSDIQSEWNEIKKRIPRKVFIHASPPKRLLSWFLFEMNKGKWSWTLECDYSRDTLSIFIEKGVKFHVIKCCDYNAPHDSRKIISSNVFKESPISNGKISIMEHWSKNCVTPTANYFCFEKLKRSIKAPCFHVKKTKQTYWCNSNDSKELFTIRDVARLQTFPEYFDVSGCCMKNVQCATPVSVALLIVSLIKTQTLSLPFS